MARRMISTDISMSVRLESCSEWAQLLFDRMIAHQDEWGRLIGDPGKVKAKLKPLSRRGPKQFEKAIAELSEAGLICWYAVNDHPFIAMKPQSFDEYQGNTHAKAVGQGRRSQYPAPPDDVFRWPEDGALQDTSGDCGILLAPPAQYNRNQDKQSKDKIKRPNGLSSPRGDLTAEQKKAHTAGMAAFDEGIKRLTELERPVGWRRADKGHAARFFKECLLEGDTAQDLLDCIAEFFERHRGYEADMRAKGKTRHTAPGFKRFRSQYTSLMRAVEERRRNAGKA